PGPLATWPFVKSTESPSVMHKSAAQSPTSVTIVGGKWSQKLILANTRTLAGSPLSTFRSCLLQGKTLPPLEKAPPPTSTVSEKTMTPVLFPTATLPSTFPPQPDSQNEIPAALSVIRFPTMTCPALPDTRIPILTFEIALFRIVTFIADDSVTIPSI